jgi:hypothetical protein
MYSDFWADPTKQNIPAAWQGQDLAQITATVQSYTQQVIGAFAKPPADLGHAAERGRALATQLYKKIVIAETQYPWTLASGNSPIGDSTGNFVWESSQLSAGHPASPGRGSPGPASAPRTPTSRCSTPRAWPCRRSGSGIRPPCARPMTPGSCRVLWAELVRGATPWAPAICGGYPVACGLGTAQPGIGRISVGPGQACGEGR